jgi:hypothetical protein
MHLTWIVAVVVVAALSLGSALGRRGSPWGRRLSLSAGLLLRLLAGFVFALEALRAGERGGAWFVAIAVILGVLAAATFALAGLVLWGVAKFGFTPDDDRPLRDA